MWLASLMSQGEVCGLPTVLRAYIPMSQHDNLPGISSQDRNIKELIEIKLWPPNSLNWSVTIMALPHYWQVCYAADTASDSDFVV